MVAWQRIAAWTLLALALTGALLPPLILFLLKPKRLVHTTWAVSGKLPLDAFFLLDASSSVRPQDWVLSLNFARDMASQLNTSLPHFRAGLGQFSEQYQLESKLSPRIGTLPQDLQQLKGATFMDRALCGDQEGFNHSECSRGALADLTSTAKPKLEEDGRICGIQQPTQLMLMVTDGVPTDGQAALASAQYLKRTTNVTLMGVLVGGQMEHAQALYALTSCCDPGDMGLQRGQPACLAEPDWTCPYMVRSTSYHALVKSSDRLVHTLTLEMECQGLQETWNMRTDLRSLWFLLLPVPVVFHLLSLHLRAHLCPLASPDNMYNELDPVGEEELADIELCTADPGHPTDAVANVSNTFRSQVGPPPAQGASRGYSGKKWAPVRTAYIVAGQRLDVDYGRAAPPMAPNAARRGHELESIRDTPEAYFANLDKYKKTMKTTLPLLSLKLVDTLADTGGETIVPRHPWCSCGVLAPLTCTLALLPLVVLLSGILNLLGGLGT